MILKAFYETKISTARWMAYDLPGNVGWIAYIAALVLCFVRRPDFMRHEGMAVVAALAILPALLMLVGIVELICERVLKLDRVLPRRRLLLGFGALTLGGVAGAAVALAGLVYGALAAGDCDLTLMAVMLAGALLCAVFAGLLYRGYHPREEMER